MKLPNSPESICELPMFNIELSHKVQYSWIFFYVPLGDSSMWGLSKSQFKRTRKYEFVNSGRLVLHSQWNMYVYQYVGRLQRHQKYWTCLNDPIMAGEDQVMWRNGYWEQNDAHLPSIFQLLNVAFYSTPFGGRVYKWKFCPSVCLSVVTSDMED